MVFGAYPARNPHFLRIVSVELGHFNAGQLADYFSGLWTPDQQREIEIHLSQCDTCTTLARQVYVDMFVIDNWTAKAKKANAATRSAAAH
jgi:hypothetical protein